MSSDRTEPQISPETYLPTSGFTMLGDPDSAACVGDSCAVPGATEH